MAGKLWKKSPFLRALVYSILAAPDGKMYMVKVHISMRIESFCSMQKRKKATVELYVLTLLNCLLK